VAVFFCDQNSPFSKEVNIMKKFYYIFSDKIIYFFLSWTLLCTNSYGWCWTDWKTLSESLIQLLVTLAGITCNTDFCLAEDFRYITSSGSPERTWRSKKNNSLLSLSDLQIALERLFWSQNVSGLQQPAFGGRSSKNEFIHEIIIIF